MATALMVKDADKLTLGQSLIVTTSHFVETLLNAALDRWITSSHIIQHQNLLLDHSQLAFAPARSLNPASLMQEDDPQEHSTTVRICLTR